MKQIRNLLIIILILFSIFSAVWAREKTEKVSGDRQAGISGNPLKEDLIVRVLSEGGKPLSGVPVIFSIIKNDWPQKNILESGKETFLSSPVAITGAEGFASTRLNLGLKEKGEVLVSASTRESLGAPAIFSAVAHTRFWILFMTLGLLGGLGIFLFGMFYLNNSLQKISGQKLKDILRKFTDSPWKGMGTGFFVTLLNQSSSATTVLEVSLVSAGIMTFYQSLAVTMGAEIGSTITAQLVAFKIADYSAFFAGAGFFIAFFSRTKRWKNIGNAIIGFGILFLGMKIMIDLLSPIARQGLLLNMMLAVENPLIGIIIGLLFTLIVQSSGATIGIVIAMAMAGAITLNQAIPLSLGAHIGTCITAFLSSIGRSRESKRVALWHVVHQIAGVALIYPFLTVIKFSGEPAWMYFVKYFTKTFFYTTDTARQIAMAHTLLPVLNAILFLPLLPLAGKMLIMLFPSDEKEKPFGPVFIDNGLLENPPLALEQAKKEIVREGAFALEMFEDSINVFDTRDADLSDTVSLKDFKVDFLRNNIVTYLTKIAQNQLSEEQSLKQTQYLYITADFEAIGDIIDKNIMPLARKKIRNELWFSDAGWKDIIDFHSRIRDNFRAIIEALEKNNMENASKVSVGKSAINAFEADLRKRHIDRINAGLRESLETSSVHLDLIGQFKRINSYLSDIAVTILGNT